jgi:hypothetical protein
MEHRHVQASGPSLNSRDSDSELLKTVFRSAGCEVTIPRRQRRFRRRSLRTWPASARKSKWSKDCCPGKPPYSQRLTHPCLLPGEERSPNPRSSQWFHSLDDYLLSRSQNLPLFGLSTPKERIMRNTSRTGTHGEAFRCRPCGTVSVNLRNRSPARSKRCGVLRAESRRSEG